MAATEIGTLRQLTSGNKNSPTNVMYNFDLIRDAFNDAFDSTTGHDHDETDSKGVSSGITELSFQHAFLLMLGSPKGGL